MNNVNCLIISSTIDYSTDLICYELERQGSKYLRLNRDQFSNYQLLYSLEDNSLSVDIGNSAYRIEPNTLKSVFFRAPVFLRSMSKQYTLQEQLERSQWSAFIRNLIVYDKVKWVNHPAATYRAENKMYQLRMALKCGLTVPNTFVGNKLPENIESSYMYAVKSLDTALFYEKGQEMFTYTTMMSGEELLNAKLQDAPVMIQECLQNKIDIRVTIVGDLLFPVAITSNRKSIPEDWRKIDKDSLEYATIDLPTTLQAKIRKLMKLLNLNFGGMDLVKVSEDYYFIEVNPTGEWGWLATTAKLPIDKAIVSLLTSGGANE